MHIFRLVNVNSIPNMAHDFVISLFRYLFKYGNLESNRNFEWDKIEIHNHRWPMAELGAKWKENEKYVPMKGERERTSVCIYNVKLAC